MSIDIRFIIDSDVEEVATFMAASFLEDPLYRYFVPEREAQIEFMKGFFAFRLRYAMNLGKVYVTTDKKGVAAWIPPNTHMLPEHLMRFGGMAPMMAIGEENAGHVMEFSEFAGSIEEEYAPMPHWHLSPLAVDPDYWGKGYAHKLLCQMLDDFDCTGQYCFLETQTTKNRDIYEKHGFVILKEAVLPNSNIPHYAMLRKPRIFD